VQLTALGLSVFLGLLSLSETIAPGVVRIQRHLGYISDENYFANVIIWQLIIAPA
jgi:hypothetical protein